MDDNKLEKINANLRYFYETVMKIETLEECEALFDDMCTKTELASISQRVVVAKMLSEKKVYSDIVTKTGASTATISRVNRSLIYGCDGYEMVFSRIDKKEEE